MFSSTFLWFSASLVAAQYSVYQPKDQVIFGGTALTLTAATSTAAPSNFTGAAAYDHTVLNPPAVPSPAIPTHVPIQLPSSGGLPNLSYPVNGAFMGFSIEMSVAPQILGKNSTRLLPPFLNLMANIVERAGWVQVRVGGNSQEMAYMVSSLPNATMLAKDNVTFGVTNTPSLLYTPDLLYTMSNISRLTNTHWHLGFPFAVSGNVSLAIVENGQSILGDYLLGIQAGNEPDLYSTHGLRPSNYSQYDYFGEIGALVQQIANDSAVPNKNNILVVPSVQVLWSPESVWNTGLVSSYSSSIYALAVERYPNDNCAAKNPAAGQVVNPQDVFIDYLQHNISTNLVASYLNSTAFAHQNGKPLMMFETNSASCSGFPGISNSFGAALWGLDWALTMAYNGFTSALFHVGGQNSYYNPFTPPPTNQTKFGIEWTVGPIYYSALVMAEVMGPHNQSQISDITSDISTPMYAIFENGAPTKLALFNFVTDPTGASTYTAVISIGGGSTNQSNATPSQVQVKYLLAPSVSSKGNFTWAGQTLGDALKSDGRLNGTLNVTTIQCDQTANTCSVPVPAPAFALVFLTSDSFNAVSPTSTVTFPTSVQTRSHFYIDPNMLATSYGHTGMQKVRGATSSGHLVSGASSLHPSLSCALAILTVTLAAIGVAQRW
ncbi:hypothetical protein F5148DRAFT_1378092 [Russula earlei]|uniref:Uncharacterized protein n=1 Tax=Russula earlei TaxID=71964 RepID=A0ACC0U279_9AGAM|nr:hypothetical protein F5148DRAFT_1378092 [Russula earlei]